MTQTENDRIISEARAAVWSPATDGMTVAEIIVDTFGGTPGYSDIPAEIDIAALGLAEEIERQADDSDAPTKYTYHDRSSLVVGAGWWGFGQDGCFCPDFQGHDAETCAKERAVTVLDSLGRQMGELTISRQGGLEPTVRVLDVSMSDKSLADRVSDNISANPTAWQGSVLHNGRFYGWHIAQEETPARENLTYVGTYEADGTWSIKVWQPPNEGVPLDPRLDLRSHAPAGFSWGYSGSGPAQAALALLAHHLGDDERAMQLYQRFKEAVLSRLPQTEGWTMTPASIDAALLEIERGILT